MTQLTQKQLIDSLKQLKEIKPNREWAVLLKSQVIAEQKGTEIKANKVGIMDVFASILAPRKLAYSLAVLLFLVVGIFGFTRPSTTPTPAGLTAKIPFKQNAVAFNSSINNLAQVTKEGKTDSIASAKTEVNTTAKGLMATLKANPVQDTETIKNIAASLKTLADVTGSDLSADQDIKDLYQTVVQSQIEDLQKTTLNDDQKKALIEAQDLYTQGKYADALEKLLLISK